jgi:hypothetical protein
MTSQSEIESTDLPKIELTEQTSDYVIFTACSVNYLDKAIAMCLSVLDHHPDARMVILLADGKRKISQSHSRISILWAQDIGFPDYLKCAFKYNIIEFNTALKPFVARHLLRSYETVIYLDPDVCVFSPLESVFSSLESHSAVFTPHATTPYIGEGRPRDRDLLRFGSCNLGFFAVKRSNSSDLMLRWWHDCCKVDCFYDPHQGLGVDQKWIDLVFSFFDDMKILKDIGLNVAFWNLHEREISSREGTWYVNDKIPLKFVHFSSFIEADEDAVADKQTRYAPGSRKDFSRVASIYRSYLIEAKNFSKVDDSSYSYGKFSNGDNVSAALRRFYAISEQTDIVNADDPFQDGGVVHKFALKNGLISKQPVSSLHANFKMQAGYSMQQRIITKAFRSALWILGPDRYFNLMRYLAHYSSLLNQSDLFHK